MPSAKLPKVDKDAQKIVGAIGRVQTPKGQVRLLGKERPEETAGLNWDRGGETESYMESCIFENC